MTICVCFVPGLHVGVIILLLVVQKVVWALNLAASCGCLSGSGTAPAGSTTGSKGGLELRPVPGAL